MNERNRQGQSLLHMVATDEQNDFWKPRDIDHTALAELLLKHGADINLTDIDNCRTPIMTAVICENLSIIKVLVSFFYYHGQVEVNSFWVYSLKCLHSSLKPKIYLVIIFCISFVKQSATLKIF